jgi:hypothetical protein
MRSAEADEVMARDSYLIGETLMGYVHLYFASNSAIADHLVCHADARRRGHPSAPITVRSSKEGS